MATVHKSTVSVGPVTTTPTDTRQNLTVNGWRLCVFSTDTGEPRIRDLDLAERLGYKKTHNIRDLIRGLIRDGKLREIQTIRQSRMIARSGRGQVRVDEEEFWLTEAQALKVVAKSGTDTADAILDEMIEVFRLAIRGLLSPERAGSADDRLARFLLAERQNIARFLDDRLIFEVCRIYGYGHHPGNPPPQFFRMVAERFYALLFGKEVHDEMRRCAGQRKYYQFLTDNAQRMAQRDLDILLTLARQCFSPDEFWMRVEAHFKEQPLQGSLLLS